MTKTDVGYLWAARIVAICGVIVAAGAALATGPMLIHGHPAYLILLAAAFVISVTVGVRSWRLPASRKSSSRGRRVVPGGPDCRECSDDRGDCLAGTVDS